MGGSHLFFSAQMTAKKMTTAKETTAKKTKATTVKTTKKPRTPKSVLKAITAAKKAAGKTAKKAHGKKMAAAMKKAGKGIFAPKTLSAELAAICGGKVMPRTEVTKKVWVYIKKYKLNAGRIITPDASLRPSSRWRASTC